MGIKPILAGQGERIILVRGSGILPLFTAVPEARCLSTVNGHLFLGAGVIPAGSPRSYWAKGLLAVMSAFECWAPGVLLFGEFFGIDHQNWAIVRGFL
ncbi:hypothetical protein BCV73_29230 [Paenibacillus sp. SSG-1]|nr:hypothetical protein BCV73_29230 [Paenibacillus sp. SSG-1]